MDVFKFLQLSLRKKQVLTKLIFSNQDLSALDYQTQILFINAIADCSRLREIHLNNTQLNCWSARNFQRLCRTLSNRKNLLHVNLANNGLEGANINFSPLWMTAATGCYQATEALIKLGAKIDAPENVGENETNSLWIAAAHNHLPLLKLLLKHGASVNSHSGNLFVLFNQASTPLTVAAFYQHPASMECLLEHGAGLFMDLYSHPFLLESLTRQLQIKTDRANPIEILLLHNNRYLTTINELKALPLEVKLKLIMNIPNSCQKLLLPGVATILRSAALENKAKRYFRALEDFIIALNNKEAEATEFLKNAGPAFVTGFNIYKRQARDVRACIAAATTHTTMIPETRNNITLGDQNLEPTQQLSWSLTGSFGSSLSICESLPKSSSLENDRPLKKHLSFYESKSL